MAISSYLKCNCQPMTSRAGIEFLCALELLPGPCRRPVPLKSSFAKQSSMQCRMLSRNILCPTKGALQQCSRGHAVPDFGSPWMISHKTVETVSE